jgi:ADP-ribosyl-[dinitrogen reductase] hydrolase
LFPETILLITFLIMNYQSKNPKVLDAILGALIGDALSMPAHWFYNTKALKEQLGIITSYLAPPLHHPDSIFWRSEYPITQPEFDILGDQRVFWGQRSIHYHRQLKAGENTLNAKLLQLTLEQVIQNRGYNRDLWIETYLTTLKNPKSHRDTYVEECHRGFFLNLAKGIPPAKCAIKEKHIGGMVSVIPLYVLLRNLGKDHWLAQNQVLSHVAVTHGGEEIKNAANSLLEIAQELWEGAPMAESLQNHSKRQDLPYFQGPLERLSQLPPQEVLGKQFSTACYLDHSLPGVAYLALRYPDDPKTGLVENTMAGGDNCGRGAVLGALYGLSQGLERFPSDWVEGLVWQPSNVFRT